MTKKYKLMIGLATSVALLGTSFAALATSLGWFDRSAKENPSWKAQSDGAYFAYGDGTARKSDDDVTQGPYGITSPRHLYNLAWLQYMGHFNKDNDGITGVDTVYFELGNDVDMTGWTLPPIGTTKNPFLGNFNGNGHTISNLTISNSISDYNQVPFTGVDRSDFDKSAQVVNVVGLFGVVGSYYGQSLTYDSQTNQISNTAITDLTVKSVSDTTLVGLAAGYVNGTLSGVAVNNSSIDLSGSKGAYISSEITTNLSDYSLIGYAASDEYLNKIQSSTTLYEDPNVSNPYSKLGGDEWGGSINVKNMYAELKKKVLDTTNRESTLYTSSDIDYHEEEATSPSTTFTPIASTEHSRSSTSGKTNSYKGYTHYYYRDFAEINGNQVQTSSYSFSDDTGNGYIGLSGRYEFDKYYKYTKKITHEGTKSSIRISFGSNYLRATESSSNGYDAPSNSVTITTNGTLSNTTTASNATNWVYDSTTKTLATSIDAIVYYLYNNNGTLELSPVNSSAWDWVTESGGTTFKTGGRYLFFDGSAWTLISSIPTEAPWFYIGDGNGNYLTTSGTTGVTNTTNKDNSIWYFETGGTQYVYTIINSTKYYLQYSSGVRLTNSNNASNRFYRYNSNYIRYSYTLLFFSYTYYLRYSNGWDSGNTQYSLSIDHSSNYQYEGLTQTGTTTTWDTSTFEKSDQATTLTTYPTYFPITWADGAEKDTYDTTKPSPKNSGYILGGEYYDGAGNGGKTLADLRLSGDGNSQYNNSNLSGAGQSGDTYSKTSMFAYTFDSTGALVRIKDPVNNLSGSGTPAIKDYDKDLHLKKYYKALLGKTSGSRVSLDEMLNSSVVYGMHFMNADISMNHIIQVPYAMVNGQEYTDYELPEDSINFALKKEGYINFFAHTMFLNGSETNPTWSNSNNCFFSLHVVDRTEKHINAIHEIDKIFLNSEHQDNDKDSVVPKYVYSYRDGTSDNTGVRDDNGNFITGTRGSQVFDTRWLTDPEYSKFELKAIYYFEIPVNKGEYALGSVSGTTSSTYGWSQQYNKNGAYLMYLDIGANKKSDTAVIIDEKSTTTTSTYTYPKGVDFVKMDNPTEVIKKITNPEDVQGGESSAIKLTTANTLIIQYTYTAKVGNNDALLTVGPASGEGEFTATYKRFDTAVQKGNSTEIPVVATTSEVDVMERESTYDLTLEEGATNKMSVVETHTDGNGTRTEASWSEDVTWTEDDINAMMSFEGEEINLFTMSYNAPIGQDGSKMVRPDIRYDALNHNVTINFISTDTTGTQEVAVRFTSMDLSQTFGEGTDATTINFTVEILNNGVSTGTAYGGVTEDIINQDIYLIVNQKS